MTSLDISPLVLGTMTFGDTVDAAGSAKMFDAAVDAGITHIDTANGYAGGESERILADLLATRRDRVTLATKAGMPNPDAGDNSPLSPKGLRLSVEANRVADEVGAPRPIVAQQLYNLLARRIEEEYVEFADVTGLITMVYNPLGGGLLTGKHSLDATPTDGRFGDSRLAAMYRERYWNTAIFDAVAQLTTIADEAGVPLTELALRWLVSKPAAGPILLGGSKVEHLQSNIAAIAKGPLGADVVDACDDVGSALRGPMPNYNR